MTIKVIPQWENPTLEQKREFQELIEQLMKLGLAQLLLYFDDGSVLLKK